MPRRVYDVDHAVDDTPTRPPLLPRVLAGVGLVPWVLCGLATLGVGAMYVLAMGQANGAVQEAAIGTAACTGLIGVYCLARSAEKVIAGLGRMANRGE